MAEAWVARAKSARSAAAMKGNAKVFFIVILPVRGSWKLAEIFSLFESSGAFTSWEVDEIFSELFFMA